MIGQHTKMDPLTQLMLQRQMGAAPQASPSGAPPIPTVPTTMGLPQAPTPAVPPSGGTTHTPPQAQRFANAQEMMEAYRNGWSPNPMLVQASNGNH